MCEVVALVGSACSASVQVCMVLCSVLLSLRGNACPQGLGALSYDSCADMMAFQQIVSYRCCMHSAMLHSGHHVHAPKHIHMS